MKRTGFSLVELALALVIIGLLVGGVLTGQSLIRASQLRVITQEYQRFVTATLAFNDKFGGLPGDIKDATSYWGASTYCSGTSNNGTCNGNGDGYITYPGVSGTGEPFEFWNQLSLAGLIEGKYTGASCIFTFACTSSANAPTSKFPLGQWYTNRMPTAFVADATNYAGDYGGYFALAGATSASFPTVAMLSPADAWNIDTKLDDGMPGTGKVIARFWGTCANSTSGTDYTGTYQLSDPSLQCALYFANSY